MIEIQESKVQDFKNSLNVTNFAQFKIFFQYLDDAFAQPRFHA